MTLTFLHSQECNTPISEYNEDQLDNIDIVDNTDNIAFVQL